MNKLTNNSIMCMCSYVASYVYCVTQMYDENNIEYTGVIVFLKRSELGNLMLLGSYRASIVTSESFYVLLIYPIKFLQWSWVRYLCVCVYTKPIMLKE